MPESPGLINVKFDFKIFHADQAVMLNLAEAIHTTAKNAVVAKRADLPSDM